MKVNEKILNTVFQVAKANPVEDWPRLAAAVVRRNKIVSIGLNDKKTDPFQAKFGKNEDSIYRHAEIAAIKTAWQESYPKVLTGCILYVARAKFIRPNSSIMVYGLAKPCCGCMGAIMAMKSNNKIHIDSIVFTTDEHGVYDTIDI